MRKARVSKAKVLPEISDYIRERLAEVRETQNLSVKTMADIAGYDRGVMYRCLRGQTLIGLIQLYKLSQYLKVPMDFWFPPKAGDVKIDLPPPPVRETGIPTMLPVTRRMIKAMNRLAVPHKRRVLVLVLKHADQLPELHALATVLAKKTEEKRKKLHKTFMIFATDKAM